MRTTVGQFGYDPDGEDMQEKAAENDRGQFGQADSHRQEAF